jgi:hypothetical protein
MHGDRTGLEQNLQGDLKNRVMDSLFQISLFIKTPSGFETYGNFDLGSDRDRAMAIFGQLRGTPKVSPDAILYMDLSEVHGGIPLPLEVLHCTLEDIAWNTRIITRDVFKNLNL